ncbi:hypothetical protein ANCCAN_20638 [Ancylostoma caninum]|uniref:Uncharacterized protein n=1 Tax=Ancylostoma caninum TaxID=29170 RepID=A0A368FR83_ANCCA|nr:hypothetical protein ANCCAN_20638 [Ancylostoma caninum]
MIQCVLFVSRSSSRLCRLLPHRSDVALPMAAQFLVRNRFSLPDSSSNICLCNYVPKMQQSNGNGLYRAEPKKATYGRPCSDAMALQFSLNQLKSS